MTISVTHAKKMLATTRRQKELLLSQVAELDSQERILVEVINSVIPTYTMSDFCKKYGIIKKTADSWWQRGELVGVKNGGRIVLNKDYADEFAKRKGYKSNDEA